MQLSKPQISCAHDCARGFGCRLRCADCRSPRHRHQCAVPRVDQRATWAHYLGGTDCSTRDFNRRRRSGTGIRYSSAQNIYCCQTAASGRERALDRQYLSINILGGNFRDWATPADQFADTGIGSKVAPANSRPRTVSSTQAFEATPGRVRVSPFLSGNRLHAQTQAIDVAIVPGGAAVDQPVVVTSSLWDKDKRPIAPAQLNIELSPLRLSSIYETVEATIDLDYEISSANGSVAWSCSATSHEVLVDRDAIRPALWDVGVPTKFGAARKRWLALYSPAIGAVRAVFTTPEAASAFAAWLQQVGGAAAGKYSLGLFTPANPNEKGRILPFDTSIMDTFQPIGADEIALLKVGEIDKP